MCDFVGAPLNGLELQPMVDYINAVTGWNMSIYEVMKLGERNTLAREFLPSRRCSLDAEPCELSSWSAGRYWDPNCREGFTPENDLAVDSANRAVRRLARAWRRERRRSCVIPRG
jgi:aldehyde:ferredoxin oxidoreductase